MTRFLTVAALMLLTTDFAGATPSDNPLATMVGVRAQIGTVLMGEQRVSIQSMVTYQQTSSEWVALCYGQFGKTVTWLDLFSWDPKTPVITKTSLVTVSGHGVAIAT